MRYVFLILCVLSARTHAIVMSYQRDAAGRVASVSYDTAASTTYTYDKAGHLVSRVTTLSPFPAVAGNYAGLVTGISSGVGDTGNVSVTVTATGLISGKILVGGLSDTFRSQLDANGDTPVIDINLGGGVQLTLHLDFTGTTPYLTGSLGGVVSANFGAYRVPFSGKRKVPLGLVAKYTALLQPTAAGSTIPQGNGFATVVVGPTGSVKLVGKLADGTPFSQGTKLLGDNTWALYVPLYKKAGHISGTVAFQSLPGESDFAATVEWFKPATTGVIHPASFDTDLDFVGSRYRLPAKGTRVLDFLATIPNGTFEASDGNLSGPFTPVSLTLEPTNKVTFPAANPSSLNFTISLSGGLVNGSFLDGATVRKFQGVLFQQQNVASGYFLGSSESGTFVLEATTP